MMYSLSNILNPSKIQNIVKIYVLKLCILVLFALYFPTASVGYFLLGDCMQTNMLDAMSNGYVKKVAEGMMMVHLISAVPIVVNPPSQYFEELMEIPKCNKI